MHFNGDTDVSNYSIYFVRTVGTSPSAGTSATKYAFITDTGTSVATIQIMDYSATDKHKTQLVRYGPRTDSQRTAALVRRWADNSAISSITFKDDSGADLQSGTTISIYGIASEVA